MEPERLKRSAPFPSSADSWKKRPRISPPADPTSYSQAQLPGFSQRPPRPTEKALCHDDYTIGWICALEVELAAAEAMLEEIHPALPRVGSDPNAYNLGRIGRHNIVITCLPTGAMGTNSAATAAANLLRSFPKVRFGLMVGIGGGVPGDPSDDPDEDIRLGDIVVSKPTESLGGVIQYDFGKATMENELQRTGWLNAPPHELRTGVLKLQARHRREGSLTPHFLVEMLDRYPRMAKEFCHQGAEHDRLFHAHYAHEKNEKECSGCDSTHAVMRKPRENDDPIIHYGLIGSANRVVKSGTVREKLRQELKILCVEMEAAGLMNNFPCLVVRGIADYADTHKNKRWQPYAAATAAAYAKELLQMIPAVDVECMTEAAKLPGILREEFTTVNAKLDSLMHVARLSSENRDLAQQFRMESASQMQRMEDKLKQLLDYMEESRSMPTPLKILFRKLRGSANGRKESQWDNLWGEVVTDTNSWHQIMTPGSKIVMDITFRRGKLAKHSCPRCNAVHDETMSRDKRVTCYKCRLDFDMQETNRVVELPDEDDVRHVPANQMRHSTDFQPSKEEPFLGMGYINQEAISSPPTSSRMSMPSSADIFAPTTDSSSNGQNVTGCDYILRELLKGVDTTSFTNIASYLHNSLGQLGAASSPESALNMQARDPDQCLLQQPARGSEFSSPLASTSTPIDTSRPEAMFPLFSDFFENSITDDQVNDILSDMSTTGPWFLEDPLTAGASLPAATYLPLNGQGVQVTHPSNSRVPSNDLSERQNCSRNCTDRPE